MLFIYGAVIGFDEKDESIVASGRHSLRANKK